MHLQNIDDTIMLRHFARFITEAEHAPTPPWTFDPRGDLHPLIDRFRSVQHALEVYEFDLKGRGDADARAVLARITALADRLEHVLRGWAGR